MASTPLRPSDPAHLGSYRLIGRLGEGGMGSVFLGETPAGRQVAVKLIRPDLSADPGFRARFRSEVKRVRQVPPFCTAEVLDADADHDPPYLVVEYVDGPSLADLVRDRGPLSGTSLHSVAIGVTTALAAIHDAGVVHRDLKPANVLFAPLGIPKVIDFGIAKALDTSQHHTVPGQILGTIAYMGPERFHPQTAAGVGTAADIFAWGAVVTYAATGHTPFAPETLIATAGGIPLPAPDLAGLPRPLRELVAAALHEDPPHRPTAHDLLEHLVKAGAAGDPVISASLDSRPLKRATAAVRHTLPMAAAATRASTPVRQGLATLQEPPPGRSRRRPPRTLVAVAAAALAAGFAAYPITGSLVTPGSGTRTVPTASPPADPALGDRNQNDKASRSGRHGHCTLDGPLRVSPRQVRTFTCPAPTVATTEQSVHTQITVTSANACAAIRTHATDDDGYRITLCTARVALAAEHHGRTHTLAVATVNAAAGTRHDVEITAAGTGMTVSIDRHLVISRTRLTPQLPPAAVILDAVPAPDTPYATGTVTYTDVTVTATP